MSDLSSEMSQMLNDTKRHRHATNEYRIYLGLIFLTAVPFCTVIWAYTLFRNAELPAQGPIQSALSEARTITPRIFSA
ncbi:MAG: cytochrome PufQ [Paracoccaceae bacterium]